MAIDGVVCTDWGITMDESPDITNMMGGGRCWGVEKGYFSCRKAL